VLTSPFFSLSRMRNMSRSSFSSSSSCIFLRTTQQNSSNRMYPVPVYTCSDNGHHWKTLAIKTSNHQQQQTPTRPTFYRCSTQPTKPRNHKSRQMQRNSCIGCLRKRCYSMRYWNSKTGSNYVRDTLAHGP